MIPAALALVAAQAATIAAVVAGLYWTANRSAAVPLPASNRRTAASAGCGFLAC
jgi:hypothetical protein